MKTKKQLFSLLLVICLVVGLIPTVAFATGATDPTDLITVEKATYSNKNCEVWFSINETAENDVVINVGDEVTALLLENEGYIMPADQFNVTVHIKNNSPNAFLYNSKGMELGTKKVSEDDALFLTDFVGYDGNRIDLPRIASIDYSHPAMKELFNKTISSNDDYQLVVGIYGLLENKGYTGDSALSDYLLDYYKNKYLDDNLTWGNLMEKHGDEVINDFAKSNSNVFFNLSAEELNAVKSTVLNNFTYVLGQYSNGEYQVQFKWPEAQLAALSYNIFYQDLLTMTFGEEKPNNHSGMRTRGVGDYIDVEGEPYTKADEYLATIGDDGQLESGEEGTFNMTLTLEGQGTGNMYMGYDFEKLFSLSLRLVRATTDVTVVKKWQDNGNQAGVRPDNITVQLIADGEIVQGKTLILNSDNQWTGSFKELPKYKNGQEISYTVDEVKVDNYSTVISGNAEKGFVITNSIIPPDPGQTDPTDPGKSAESGADEPQTGDNNNMWLWILLASLSLLCIATLTFRRKRFSTRRSR